MAELNRQLPGYLVPRLVREIPGAPGKLWLTERRTHFPRIAHGEN
jgi:L-lysine 2,3-aminomutase